MKKIIICLSCFILAATAAFSACAPSEEQAGEQFDKTLTVEVGLDPSQATDVSPFIYGQFIEHIPGCIYNGIWSEMIIDRKFYLPFGDFASPWTVSDTEKAFATTQKTLSGAHAATLKEGGSVRQKISTDDAEYCGYINAFSPSTATVKVTAKTKIGEKSENIDVTGTEFNKYEFSFALGADKNAEIIFECTAGEVTMDSLSLMPADNVCGMRKDTLDILKDMGGTVYRWPGGNFVSGYDWTDGIGDRDRRESKRNLHYAGEPSSFSSESAMAASDRINIIQKGFYSIIEPNDMGTDEFIAMCRYIGAEPYIVVNTGLGESDAAADWVEYCNGAATTEYGAKRAANGNGQPFGVTYWGIGNEMNGSHQLGYIPLQSQYIIKHDRFITAMKKVDPDIKVLAVGDNYSDYTKNMLEKCVNKFDYTQEHFYAQRDEDDLSAHVGNMYEGLLLRINKHRALSGSNRFGALMSIDEYAYNEVFCASRLKDAMGIAVALNLMIDNADVVGMACYSSTVNATQGCVTTTDNGVTYQGAGLVLKAYKKYMQSKRTACSVLGNADDVYVCATVSEDGKSLSLAVVNATGDRLLIGGVQGAKSVLRASVVGEDVEVYNSEASADNVRLEVKENIVKAVAPAYGVSVFVFKF